MEKLLMMVLNRVLKQVINIFVDRGIKHFSGNGKSKDDTSVQDQTQAESADALAKRARDYADVSRKLR